MGLQLLAFLCPFISVLERYWGGTCAMAQRIMYDTTKKVSHLQKLGMCDLETANLSVIFRVEKKSGELLA